VKGRMLCCTLLACLTLGLSTAGNTDPAPAPSAFAYRPTHGVSILSFVSGQLSYTLTLASDAYFLCGGNEYPITDIWGFYAVNKTGNSDNDFTADGPAISEWAWDQNPNEGSLLEVGGWFDKKKNEALAAPESGSVSKTFSYTQFSFTGTAPVMGLHVSVSIPEGLSSPFSSEGITGDIIPQTTPEPSGMIAMLVGLGTSLIVPTLRRLKRT